MDVSESVNNGSVALSWKPIYSAPKNATEILLLVEKNGERHALVAHWAEGGGEDQPRFGPAWFRWTEWGYQEIDSKPTHWAPLPEFRKWV